MMTLGDSRQGRAASDSLSRAAESFPFNFAGESYLSSFLAD
jgi:hypothetical protein